MVASLSICTFDSRLHSQLRHIILTSVPEHALSPIAMTNGHQWSDTIFAKQRFSGVPRSFENSRRGDLRGCDWLTVRHSKAALQQTPYAPVATQLSFIVVIQTVWRARDFIGR